MTNMKDSVRCTNCKSCIGGQQRSVPASVKNSGKTWKDCGRAASKTSSKSNFGEGCSAEISEVRNVRKGRARLCKASKAGIRRWDESLAKQVRGDLGRWQTYANSMQCGRKTFQISWYVTICHDMSACNSKTLFQRINTLLKCPQNIEKWSSQQIASWTYSARTFGVPLIWSCSWTVVEYGKHSRSKAPMGFMCLQGSG